MSEESRAHFRKLLISMWEYSVKIDAIVIEGKEKKIPILSPDKSVEELSMFIQELDLKEKKGEITRGQTVIFAQMAQGIFLGAELEKMGARQPKKDEKKDVT